MLRHSSSPFLLRLLSAVPRSRAAKSASEKGLTLIECLVAIVIISITVVAITPPIFVATASRIQSRRAEQANAIAQAEIDRIRTVVERGSKYTAEELPASGDGAVAAPTIAAATGVDKNLIEKAQKENDKIKWHGTLTNEFDIAPIMKRANFVFVPGLSGLSINHAFAYGKPYFTLQSNGHGPEIAYLIDNENGFILSGELQSDVEKIKNFLLNKEKMKSFCSKAKEKNIENSVDKWVLNMKNAFTHE